MSIEYLQFLYRALGFYLLLIVSQVSITEYLLSFPELTTTNISKLSTPDINILGYLDSKRNNLHSTKPKEIEDE